MPGVAIVAIPAENDYVWRISSEKIPHMTLLFLGDISPGPELARIETFLDHVVSTSMTKFYMEVDRRGTLGPDKADVLFFEKKGIYKQIAADRQNMLANVDIRKAYESADQFPEWTPHLTLGYPATPAKEDTRDYPGITWVNFDRVALWVDNFDGPTFQLKDNDRELAMKMLNTDKPSMESVLEHRWAEDFVNSLEHHGVKGMKWGVRKDRGHEGEQASLKTIAKADKKFERTHQSSMHSWVNVQNTFAKHINPQLDVLNSNPKYANKNLYENKSLHDSYFKDYEKLVSKACEATSKEIGTNASGTRMMKVTRHGFGVDSTWGAELVDVKHADGLTSFMIFPKFNATGHIVSQEIKPMSDTVTHDAFEDLDDILEHHGIKGMKWGVRRSPEQRLAAATDRQQLKNVRIANRAAVRDAHEKATIKHPSNSDIRNARKNSEKVNADVARARAAYKVSKAQYRIDKEKIGKTQAKTILEKNGKLTLQKAKARHRANFDLANKETTDEAVTRIIMDILSPRPRP